MGCLVKLVLALVVLVALLVGALFLGDAAARHFAQNQVAERIDQAVPGSQSTVQISSPFLIDLAFSGSVHRLTSQVSGVTADGVSFTSVDVEVDGVKISRSQLLFHRRLVISKITKAVVTAHISQLEVDTLANAPLTLGNGVVTVTEDGVQATGQVTLVDNKLQVTGPAGLSVLIPIPNLPVLPCAANLQVVPGQLLVTCTTTTIPPAFNIPSSLTTP
jgi:hypothetical protein